MRKGVLLSAIAVGILSLAVFLVLSDERGQVQAQTAPFKVLVVDDAGGVGAPTSRMSDLGWTVDIQSRLEVDIAGAAALEVYDVVWLIGGADVASLHYLVSDGGPVDLFVRNGGIVAVMNLSATQLLLDVAPGGVDLDVFSAAGTGSATITDSEHIIISGDGTGGTVLVASDLDPDALGGDGTLINTPPEGEAVVIASDGDGAVLLEYSHVLGSVLVCTLPDPQPACIDNILLYLQAIAV